MRYRRLGRTGVMVSEIGLGGEWLERHSTEECAKIIQTCEEEGINILDCWMSEPNVRSNIGKALKGRRERWYIQGHICSTWQNGQYVRTRDVQQVKPAFEDLLTRLQTDYVDFGMLHYIDNVKEFEEVITGEVYQYVLDLKAQGKIHHIGMSTHNPEVAQAAVKRGVVDLILFSLNPAFDIMPATDNLENYFADEYDENLKGLNPIRSELYRMAEQKDIGITVMKGYAGGRLFDAERSPFKVALTPIQCLHYALTRPAVASVMVGVDTQEHVRAAVAYETAGDEEKDYATVLANAPKHTYTGQCTYCGHCKPCPKNIDIAMVNKLLDLAGMQDQIPSSLTEHYKALEVPASECISCHACESRCPFGVKIAERMDKAAKTFQGADFVTKIVE